MRTHQNVDIEQHIEQDINTDLHLFDGDFSLDAVSVESHVPVGQVIQKLNKFWDDGIQFVLVHLFTDVLDKILQLTLDPTFGKIEAGS